MNLRAEYTKVIRFFEIKFSKSIRKGESAIAECLLILALSLHFNLNTIGEVSESLGIAKDKLYRKIHDLSTANWRKLFESCFHRAVVSKLLELGAQSDSSWSRAGVQISIDDSVLRKRGAKLSFLGEWWSGQFGKVVKGYDVVLGVLLFKDEVIPIVFWLQSKKDNYGNRHTRIAKALQKIGREWSAMGIDISRIPITGDGAYADSNLINSLQEVGFSKFVFGAKSNMILSTKEEDLTEGASSDLSTLIGHRQVSDAPKQQWAIPQKVATVKGYNPSFGKITVLARMATGKLRRVFAVQIQRTAEIYRIWKGHYKIEQLFKILKQQLAWGKYRFSA